MSGGVISPTNLSLYSTPVTTPRTTPRVRWNNPFLLEEDFMMTQSSNNPENNSVILMEEGKHFFCYIVQRLKPLLFENILLTLQMFSDRFFQTPTTTTHHHLNLVSTNEQKHLLKPEVL